MPIIKLFMTFVFLTLSVAGAAQSEQAKLRLLVEDNYPHATFNRSTNSIEGLEVALVVSLMDTANIEYTLTILPWNRAYREALNEPNTCVLPINYTPERESLFQWVTPTQTGGWAVFQRPDSDVVIEKIEDLAGYSVVGKMGSRATDEVEEIIGKSVMRAATDIAAAQMVYRNRADLLLSGIHDGPAATDAAKLPRLKLAYLWKPANFGLACSKSTDPALIEQLNQANQKRLKKMAGDAYGSQEFESK